MTAKHTEDKRDRLNYRRRPNDGAYVSWVDTKIGGPYGQLAVEDLKKVKGKQKTNQR